jgi:hypothetical protein
MANGPRKTDEPRRKKVLVLPKGWRHDVFYFGGGHFNPVLASTISPASNLKGG